MEKPNITNIVISDLREILLETYGQEETKIPRLNEATRLIGRDAVLDSLGLVTLIVNIEQKLSDDYGILLTIADERAMSQNKSPFRTVDSLSEYISMLIEEQRENVGP